MTLDSTTWEQRQGRRDEQGRILDGPRMTTAQIIIAMGPLHVDHPGYKEKSPPVISVVHRHENLVKMHGSSFSPVYQQSTWGAIKTLIKWAMR